jgi:hypothetical protein
LIGFWYQEEDRVRRRQERRSSSTGIGDFGSLLGVAAAVPRAFGSGRVPEGGPRGRRVSPEAASDGVAGSRFLWGGTGKSATWGCVAWTRWRGDAGVRAD